MPLYEQTYVSTGTFAHQLPTGTSISPGDIFIIVHNPTGAPQMQQVPYSLLQGTFQPSGSISTANFITGSWTQLQGRFQPSGTSSSLPSSFIDGLKIQWTHASGTSVGSGKAYTESGDLLTITGSIATVHTGLSTSAWYHVYAYLSGGAVAIEYSTTVPASPYNGTARSKTGDTSRRYVGSFITDSSAAVRKFQHDVNAGYLAYLRFRSDTSPHRLLNNGKSGSATAVSLTGSVALTALEAYIRVTNLGEKTLYTSDDNGVSATQNTVALTAGNVATQSAFLLHPVDNSQQVWYAFASTVTGSFGGFIDVLGYTFER